MVLLVMLGIGLAILLTLAVTLIVMSIQDANRAKEQRELELKLANERNQCEREIAQQRREDHWKLLSDREQEQALQIYEEDLSALLLSGRLHPRHPVREYWEVAQARTSTVLQELNPRRKGFALQFLHEAGLINAMSPIIDLAGIDLHETYLTGSDLHKVNLKEADLRKADLRDTDLSEAILVKADLTDANLTGADLSDADLRDAKVSDAQLKSAKSSKGAIMPNEKIHYVFVMP